MSRIGYLPIKIQQGVTVTVEKGGDYHHEKVVVVGPKGTLELSLRRGVSVKIEEDTITLTRDNDSKQNKSYHGLYRSMINNMIQGVVQGYSKSLEIVGIGYRVEQQGNKYVFSLGLSHKINFEPPMGISIIIEEQTKFKVEGADKQLVGEVAAKIRSFREPEPYKGKGIRYAGELVRKKSAKSA